MTALKAGGCGHARIIFRHVLRNILPSVIALATMEIGSIILSIAGFFLIGLGVQAPTLSIGAGIFRTEYKKVYDLRRQAIFRTCNGLYGLRTST